MRNIFRIFISDVKAIVTHFFAAVIIGAVLVIPALYAWVNIYANWDPYGATGNVPIGLASRDLGYTTETGETVNKGREIVEEIAQSTSIKWVVAPSAEEAIAAVERGETYGALVMGEHLSRNMYDLKAALQDKEPSIVFYQNAKTNAIANKISSTAASTAEYNIQVKYLSVLIEGMLGEVEDILDEMSPEESLDDLIRVLSTLEEHLRGYISMIQGLRDREGEILAGLDSAGQGVGGVDLSDARARAESVKNAAASIENQLLGSIGKIDAGLKSLRDRIAGMEGSELTKSVRDGMVLELKAIEAEIEALQRDLPGDSLMGAAVSGSLSALRQRAQSLEQALSGWDGSGDPSVFKQSLLTALDEMRAIVSDSLEPGLKLFFDNMVRDMDIMVRILASVNTTVADIQPVLSAAKGTVVAVNGSMAQLQTVLRDAADSIDKLLAKAIQARDSDLLGELIEILGGDPRQFAEFFAQPVTVVTETIYPVANYGTAMAPFYSTLAIWVGCVVSGAVIKPEPEESEKLRGAKPHQLFLGRFLIFFVIGQIQAAVIVAGDIWLLGCQCVHPGLFFLTAAVASLVFNILIYSLTVTFGDIGKAIGVVIMIVQIAGSSGSYPIEILPEIFSKIYTFFPFPYAINAMRETLCGLYRLDLLKYLAELSVFGVFGLLIGLGLRGHFKGVNAFVEEEMEETGVL